MWGPGLEFFDFSLSELAHDKDFLWDLKQTTLNFETLKIYPIYFDINTMDSVDVLLWTDGENEYLQFLKDFRYLLIDEANLGDSIYMLDGKNSYEVYANTLYPVDITFLLFWKNLGYYNDLRFMNKHEVEKIRLLEDILLLILNL